MPLLIFWLLRRMLHPKLCICVYVYMFICVYAYVYVNENVYVYVYIYMYMYMYIYVYVYVYVYIYMYIYKYIYIYILGCFSCPFFCRIIWRRSSNMLLDQLWRKKPKKSDFENLYPCHARPENRKNALFY